MTDLDEFAVPAASDSISAPAEMGVDAPSDEPEDFVYVPAGPRELADAKTLAALDFEAVRTMVAAQTATDRARERARAMTPLVDIDAVRLEQGATVEMRALANDAGFAIARSREVGELVALAARGGTLAPDDLRDVGIALASADGRGPSRAREPRADLTGARRCRDAIARGRRGDRPFDRRGRPGARSRLARAREDSPRRGSRAERRAGPLLDDPATGSLCEGDPRRDRHRARDGRFVVPVKAEFSGMLPGVVHDTSSTGHTLFVEPLDALDVNNRVRTLKIDEMREIARVLGELSALVGARAEAAQTNLAVLADLDLVLARVRVAQAMDARAPIVLDAPHIDVRDGRHPLLLDRAVPQSVALDDDVRMVIISGPNMGGKTVALKLVGLFVAMTYCGMQLPAGEGTTIGAFDYVGAEVGDEQSIAGNASTFSAHLARLRAILARAGERALVLVDEIASGTEAASSAALAIAVVERLLAAGTRGIVTTHATELKLFAHETPGVQNASCALRSRDVPADVSARRRLARPIARVSARSALRSASSSRSSSARSRCSRRANAITIARSPSSPRFASRRPRSATRCSRNARRSTASSAWRASAARRSTANAGRSQSRPTTGSARRCATSRSSSSAGSAIGPSARARGAERSRRVRPGCSAPCSRT